MKIAILAFNHCTASMVLGFLDILSIANLNHGEFIKKVRGNSKTPPFEIDIISGNGKPVISSSEHPILAKKSISLKTIYDLVYVPGFLFDADAVLTNEKKTILWLKNQHKKGAIITAACNGNYLVAESGLLNNRKATTHWNVANDFKNRYQSVTLEPEKILIDEGSVISAAGLTAYLNLAIYLVYRFASPQLAAFCSKIFLVDSGRRMQTPYEIFTPHKHGDSLILQVQEWLAKNITESITLESIASKSHLGRRTLLRRFKFATGDTPMIYLQKLRIEKAKTLLQTTNLTFNEITWKVGYENASSFQKLFKTETGLSPKEYRSKFLLN